MNQKDLYSAPHRRFNPLTGKWILVSPQRLLRPWQGEVERVVEETRPAYDPECYLCPGNLRASGQRNPEYGTTYVFTNDFPALTSTGLGLSSTEAMLRAESQDGTCRVICFSPRHDLSLAVMSVEAIRKVVEVWANQCAELGEQYRWVQVFENTGEIMGCSNPHPHGQIWAGTALPSEPAEEDREQRDYFRRHGRPLLPDYTDLELKLEERLVVLTEHWMAVIPYWATWPFEVLLAPRRHVLSLQDLATHERDDLALVLKRVLTRYDNLFEVSFPYSMGWHGAPTDEGDYRHWQLHAHFYPPLLRSASVRKFMVGYEMLAEPQRDLTAEQAAEQLRGLSEIHFKERRSR